MPILNVKVSAQRTPELSARIAETLLDLTTRVLGKRRDLTAVVITFVDPADWYVAGRSLADLKQSSFYFDVKVVDETNTKAEKARYIAEAFAAFEGLLGALHPESYVYVQDEWSIAPDWQLTAGLRHDQYSDFGGTTNPRLALVWDTSLDFTTKFLFGRAFRAPSFSELYSVNNPVLRGNPDLKPEVITTFETVFTWQARADTQWQLSLFKYDMKDIIRSTGLPAIRANSGRQSGEGFELEAQHRLAPDWQFTGHYAFQRTIDRSTGQSAGYAPRHHLYGRVDWLADHGWAVGLQANRVAGRERAAGDARAPVPDYTTVDLSLRSPANTRSGQWTLTVHNLFDADVREPSWYSPNSLVPVLIADDLPMAGRSIMLQWQYAL